MVMHNGLFRRSELIVEQDFLLLLLDFLSIVIQAGLRDGILGFHSKSDNSE